MATESDIGAFFSLSIYGVGILGLGIEDEGGDGGCGVVQVRLVD